MAKVVIARCSKEREQELFKMANFYHDMSSIKAYAGVECEAQFFPNDEYDLIHITEMLREKGFEYRVEEAL